MVCLRKVALALLSALMVAHLGGCAGAPAVPREIPDWVRVVVPERDGRSLFVGGAAFAVNPEAGIEAAAADARSQVHLAATKRFTDLFTRAVQRSGIETTAIERLDLKNAMTKDYGPMMVEAARQDSVFFRPCGDGARTESAVAGEPVCQVFVLVSVAADDWGTTLRELLEAQKRSRRENGERQLVEFVDWLARQTFEWQSDGARERSR